MSNQMRSQKYHNPFATRTPVLIVLLLTTLSLIALTEYACHNIPVHYGFGKLDIVINGSLKYIDSRSWEDRSTSDLNHIPLILARASSDASASARPSSTTTPLPLEKGTSTITGPGYLTPGDGLTPTPPPGPGSTPQAGSISDNKVSSTQGVASDGYIIPGSGTTPVPPPSTVTRGGPTYQATASTGYLSIGPKPSSTPNPPSTPAPIIVVANGQTSTFTPTAIASVSQGQFITPSLSVINGQTFTVTPTAQLTVIDGNTYTALITPLVTVINGQTFTQVAVGIPTKPTSAATAVHPTATFVNSTGTYLKWSNQGITRHPQITRTQYIQVALLPLILALFYTIPWRILDSTVREMEPFYQLHKREGAISENSLCLDYSTTFMWTTPFKAVRRGHFVVFWSSLISIVVLLLVPLSSSAFFVSLTGLCGPNVPGPCHAVWAVYPSFARAIEGILAFIAVLVVALIIFNYSRQSGAYSEPLSIAGLAALLYKSPLLLELREIDSQAKDSEIKSLLAGKRYKIGRFTAMDNTPCYGFVPVNPDCEAILPTATATAKYELVNINLGEVTSDLPLENPLPPSNMRMQHLWWAMKQNAGYAFSFLLFAGVLSLLSYYHWTGYDSKFEEFMNSSSFGVRIMLTSFGVVIRLIWGNIDQDLRKLEPYHRLLCGGSDPSDSILVPVQMSPYSAILPSLRKRHFLVALTCFVSVLSEFLPLFLANSVFSPAMLKQTYEVCNGASLGTLILMIITIVALMLRPRKSIRPLPRNPYTLASVLVYLASKDGGDSDRGLVDSMGGLSVLETKERNDRIRGFGALYTMGIARGGGLRIDDDRRILQQWTG